ncbi:hypothetical protein DPMN_168525 [Dreissena polymorpha]|uniref:Uncharacterized protein n=1 Tax=Dreissena polymorpha TaxID=45954 RepID=A0A9D4IZP6_DREPO|nr:hypothetical protein DPMN_168525 [Dreissena polymorpha]
MIGGIPILNFRVANDINLMGDPGSELQDLTNRLYERERPYGTAQRNQTSR